MVRLIEGRIAHTGFIDKVSIPKMVRLIDLQFKSFHGFIGCFNSKNGSIDSDSAREKYFHGQKVSIPKMVRLIEVLSENSELKKQVSIPKMVRLIGFQCLKHLIF